MEINDEIQRVFKIHKSTPFLFIGSGFSRRYIGLETWKDLLEKFSKDLNPFQYYYSSAEQSLPKTASMMSVDFHTAFWNKEEFSELRNKYGNNITSKASALKYVISDYLKSLVLSGYSEKDYRDELELFQKLNVDGIITTNWDTLIEEFLPKYKVYVGQDELLFSNPQSIGEIYKIHGSISQPNSIIITQEDYNYYNERNAYLIAKLITIFIEHPIIFIGYSISDPNIIDLLKSIIKCLGKDKINQLQNNLIFIEWEEDKKGISINQKVMFEDEIQLPMTTITTDSFLPIYSAINTIERKIPTRVLRYCKEQFYNLVKDENPKNNLHVLNFNNIEEESEIEFVVGIGIMNSLGGKGYRGIDAIDLFEDLIIIDKCFDASIILNDIIKNLQGNIPVYKYLRAIGINNKEEYVMNNLDIDNNLKDSNYFKGNTQNFKNYNNHAKGKKINEIIESFPLEKACVYIPFVESTSSDDINIIEIFLKNHFDKFKNDKSGSFKTNYRKLACYYDYLKYGWK